MTGRIVARVELPAAARGQGDLFDAVQEVRSQVGIPVGKIGRLVVGTGPGSFTGIRVALGLAHGLALANPGLRLGGVDSPRILAAAAGAALPVLVAIPWGRLRVLVTEACIEGPSPARSWIMPRTELVGRSDLAGQALVIPPALADVPLPPGVRVLPTATTPLEALAQLVAAGAIQPVETSVPAPVYLVPPDAVLPARPVFLDPGFSIQPLGLSDLEALVDLERVSFEDPWSAALLAEELEPLPDRVALGLRDPGGRLLAVGLARFEPEAMAIFIVAVHPDARRSGLGRSLVRELAERARRRGMLRIDLEVRVNNTAAVALYAGEGFVPVGRRPRYYRDGTDALLMSLTLGKPAAE